MAHDYERCPYPLGDCKHQAAFNALEAEVAKYRSVLQNQRTAWENVLDLGLLPPRHNGAARILVEDIDQALKGTPNAPD